MNLADDLVERAEAILAAFEAMHQGLADVYRAQSITEVRERVTALRMHFCEAVTDVRMLRDRAELIQRGYSSLPYGGMEKELAPVPPDLVVLDVIKKEARVFAFRVVPDVKMRQAGDHSLDPDEPKS